MTPAAPVFPNFPQVMQAWVSEERLPPTHPGSFVQKETPVPFLRGRDLLVEVRAVSINPADVKRRGTVFHGDRARPLGYDAVGFVVAIGRDVSTYDVGDEVFYAGDVTRDGSNAEFHAVDERIVGRKPSSLSDAAAVAMPLVSLTAWETLFERFGVTARSSGTLVVVAGAGGVGSVLIQLAKTLTDLTVVATASRPESAEFARRMGADHVVDHSKDLAEAVLEVAPEGSDFIFSPYSGSYVSAYERIAKPFSAIVAIDGVPGLDLTPLMRKSVSWHWEWIFTRSAYETPDVREQGRILDRIADLLDAGTISTTLTTTLRGFTPKNFASSHAISETNRSVGKTAIIR